MSFVAVILAMFVAALPQEAASQRVASPQTVFGDPISKEADEWLKDSHQRYNGSTRLLRTTWLADVSTFAVDFKKGVLTFTTPTRKVLFDVRVIGTVRKADKSWQWSWSNPNIEERLRLPADRFKETGTKYHLRYLTVGTVPVPMDSFPFMLGGVALKLHGGVGVYLVPSDEVDFYLLLSNPRYDPPS